MEYYPPSSTLSGAASSPEVPTRVLIREYPRRSIAIVSHSYALIFRHSATTREAVANGSLAAVVAAKPRGGDAGPSKCMVEFSPASGSLLQNYNPLTPRPIFGTLGLISVNRDVFLCVITQASRVASLRPGETVERILAVEFFCLNTAEYDHIHPLGGPSDWESEWSQALGPREGAVEHPCQELQKLLSNGSFYYSTDFDLTNRLQDRPPDTSTFDIDNFDESFLWNSFMIQPLVQFRSRLPSREREKLDTSRILTSAIRGFCSTIIIPQPGAPLRATRSGMPSYLSVVSRLSCRRAGTRFNSRGIDDDGNVANFVETETIFWSPSGVLFSYAQVRGSVPVFWEQTAGLIPGQQKISVTRSLDGAQPAFNKHFEELEQSYGAVHVVNLLSEAKPGEAELSEYFRRGLQHCPLTQKGGTSSQDHALLKATEYDFHAETKGPAGYEAAQHIRRYIGDSADGFAYYLAEETDDTRETEKGGGGGNERRFVVVLQQEGVFRTNCLDCLDRTNLIQTIVSQLAVEAFLEHRGERAASDFWMRHSTLWADNGDSLSRIYAGTGALKSSFTRHGKMSLAGAISDARKSATRLYINNFADKGRQNTIDVLLGRIYGQLPVVLYDPINDFVVAELNKRSSEFSSSQVINIWVGTFNLNGRVNGVDQDLSPWLFPNSLGSTQPEIFVVGFQEIVELSPQQIMNSDPTRKQMWERSVKAALNKRADALGGERYVLLRSGQLVGAALCIFVQAAVLPNIKNVEGSVKKTGMSGMAGNKGAVAIRLDYANTPICFVTAHMAAGFGNYDERNKDYATIHHGLRFQRNRGIDDHDTVIWLGDFNYRVGLTREKAIELVRKRDLPGLYENDQLNLQMVAGLAFPFYSEARINFLPTYRYDIGKDEFDSSEKQRIPAWTDRILRKGANIQQTSYNSAPLRFSDHRPVYATFQCTVSIVDEAVRESISREVYESRKDDVGDTGAGTGAEDTEDEDFLGYDAIEPGLPPASSDRQKWWLENGQMPRSSVKPPRSDTATHKTILNPKRPSNPFVPTDEPDWVTVPRGDSRPSSLSSISTSPYEHVNHPMHSSSFSNQTARKLPPPFDPAALPATKMSWHHAADDSGGGQRQETPPPPPPRRQTAAARGFEPPATTSSASSSMKAIIAKDAPAGRRDKRGAPAPPPPRATTFTASESSRKTSKSKPPPPVAKKPAHLSSLSPSSSPDLRHNKEVGTAPRTDAPGRASVSLQDVASKYSVARPPGNGGGSSAAPPNAIKRAATAAGQPGRPALGEKPKPPTRKPSMPIKPPPELGTLQPAVDLLGGDADGRMDSWQALKPAS